MIIIPTTKRHRSFWGRQNWLSRNIVRNRKTSIKDKFCSWNEKIPAYSNTTKTSRKDSNFEYVIGRIFRPNKIIGIYFQSMPVRVGVWWGYISVREIQTEAFHKTKLALIYTFHTRLNKSLDCWIYGEISILDRFVLKAISNNKLFPGSIQR